MANYRSAINNLLNNVYSHELKLYCDEGCKESEVHSVDVRLGSRLEEYDHSVCVCVCVCVLADHFAEGVTPSNWLNQTRCFTWFAAVRRSNS